jgi:hypothetical protein
VVNALEFVLIGAMATVMALLANGKPGAAALMLAVTLLIVFALWRGRPTRATV